MAAPLVDFRNIDYGGYSFMVRFKVMRHVRYRMSPGAEGIVEMSVPHTMTDEQVMDVIRDILPRLARMADRQQMREAKAVERPSHEAYTEWHRFLSQLIPMVEKEMQLAARTYTVRYMRTRWGSCSPARGTISINSALASLPNECTHYVLVHELAHMAHPDHSPAFWLHVERFYPDYRKIRAYLRQRPIL